MMMDGEFCLLRRDVEEDEMTTRKQGGGRIMLDGGKNGKEIEFYVPFLF